MRKIAVVAGAGVALAMLFGVYADAQIPPGGGSVTITGSLPAGSNTIGTVGLSGNSGNLTSTSVSVTNATTQISAAAAFTNFSKVCVPLGSTTGVWVRWDGVAATTAPPAEYMPPGQCDSWVKSTGYLPTQAWNAISNSASTIAVSVVGN